MPMPKRTDLDDYFAQLDDVARPHLRRLQELSQQADERLEEKLAWNTPAYALDGDRLWMLQAFKRHCSLRFSTEWFGPHRDEVQAAGFEAGEGFVKLPYDVELPEPLLTGLMAACVNDRG